MKWLGVITLSIALLAITGSTVFADDAAATKPDEVVLKDGTVIRGTIVSMLGGALKINNAAVDGGSVSVKFSEVARIVSETTHTFQLTDETRVVGKPRIDENSQLVVDTELQGTVPLNLGHVAFINPPPVKAVRHKGSINLSGKISDGNTRTKSANAQVEYEARSETNRLTIRGDWNYAEDSGALSARNASGSLKYDYFFSPRGFAYVNSVFQGDDFADLNLRTTLGAGLGYQFVDSTKDGGSVDFYEEAGISFFDEDFDMAKDERYAAARISGKLDWAVKPGKIAFFHFHEFYSGLEDKDDLYADTKTGFRFTILDNFFALLQVNYRWDNTPAAGANRSDAEYLWGLGYSFDK